MFQGLIISATCVNTHIHTLDYSIFFQKNKFHSIQTMDRSLCKSCLEVIQQTHLYEKSTRQIQNKPTAKSREKEQATERRQEEKHTHTHTSIQTNNSSEQNWHELERAHKEKQQN